METAVVMRRTRGTPTTELPTMVNTVVVVWVVDKTKLIFPGLSIRGAVCFHGRSILSLKTAPN
jgi:hypothetical protein